MPLRAESAQALDTEGKNAYYGSIFVNPQEPFSMEKFSLTAQKREMKKRGAQKLRAEGFIPAVLYGRDVAPLSLSVKYQDFDRVYTKAGSSSVVLVDVAGDARNVLIHEVSYDPITSKYSHIDLHQIRMDEKVRAEIDIIIQGTAPAVKEQGGILISNLDKIEIECLPGDLIHDITVSVDGLANLRDSIHVSDLKFPEGIEVITPAEEVVVLVEEPRSEAELDALNEEIKEDVESVEGVVKKEPEEGEEVAEGEAAPEAAAASDKEAPDAEKEKKE